MELKDYLKMTKIPIEYFLSAIGISKSSYFKYRTREKRPSYNVALKIKRFSKNNITLADLGWSKEGERLVDWKKNSKNR